MQKQEIQTLQFNNHNIQSIEINGQKYISSSNMATALEYSSLKSITNLFNANKDEFTENEDYTVIDLMTVKNAPYKQIFFSMQGVVLITMLAKTQKAREFREWAKKVLVEKQIQIQLPSNYVEALKCLVIAEEEKLALENVVKEKEDTIARQRITIENAQDLFQEIADKTGCVKFKACARQLAITDTELRTLLIYNGWRQKNKHFPTTNGVNQGYVKLMAESFNATLKNNSKIQKSSPTFYITEKGYRKILEQVSGILVN
jgi:prophage antirepressor-like protein